MVKCKFCEFEGPSQGINAHERWCVDNPNALNSFDDYDAKYADDLLFVDGSKAPRHTLKSRLLKRNLIKYECALCGQGPVWQGKPMTLILDHINGKNDDNRLDNLRFVCCNCDSQLPTHGSKNIVNKRKTGIAGKSLRWAPRVSLI